MSQLTDKNEDKNIWPQKKNEDKNIMTLDNEL